MSNLKNTTDPGSQSNGMKTMTLQELEQLCDDPARDTPGGVNVRALLSFEPDLGFFLIAQDGETIYSVVDQVGDQMRFRTVESALAVLQSISGLSSDIGLFLRSPWQRRH